FPAASQRAVIDRDIVRRCGLPRTVNGSELRSRPAQAPACWKSGSERGTNKDGVVQVPDRCLTSRGIIKEIVWLPVAVKVGRSYQGPATGRSRPGSSADER